MILYIPANSPLEGVLKQSDNEAYLWGRRAANKGHVKAEYAVGCKSSTCRILSFRKLIFADYTELGIGVKQDIDMAKKWYMRAAGELIAVASLKLLLTMFSPAP